MVLLWWPCLLIPDPQPCYSSVQRLDSCPTDLSPAQESTWGLLSLAVDSRGPVCRLSYVSSAPAGHLPGPLCPLTPGHPIPVSWVVLSSLPFILSPGSLFPPIFPIFPLLVFCPFLLPSLPLTYCTLVLAKISRSDPLALLGCFLWAGSLGLGCPVPSCLVWSPGDSEHCTAPLLVFAGLTGQLVVLIFTTCFHILSIGCTNEKCIIHYKLLLANSLSSFFHCYFKSFTWLDELVGPSLLMFIILVNRGNRQEENRKKKLIWIKDMASSKETVKQIMLH